MKNLTFKLYNMRSNWILITKKFNDKSQKNNLYIF